MRTLTFPGLVLLFVVLAALLLAGCAERLGDRARDLVETYCLRTSPAERDLLRLQLDTPAGPLLEVHCDRLALVDPGAPGVPDG
jgi:hypothetical protein